MWGNHQVKHLRAPNGILHRNEKMAARPLSRLWKVSDPTLFQMTLVAALLATVLGDCGPPPNLLFAFPMTTVVNQTHFNPGATVKYTCRPGYGRVSYKSSTLTCLDDTWNYSEFCTKRRCKNPGELQNGQVIAKPDHLFGSHLEFVCSEGYILIGPATSYCEIQDKGVDWSDPLPLCIIAKCEPPPNIDNGKHSGGDEDFYTYGSSVTYRCDPNFSMLGKASISCMVENKTIGVWSPGPPICKKIICSRPEVRNGKIISGLRPTYNYQNNMVFECNEGYILKGSKLIYCGEDGEWNPPPPTCELINGFSVFKKEEVIYKCHQGYTLVGEPRLSCSYSRWSPAVPQCKALCLKPEIAHATLSMDKDQYIQSENVTIQCDSKYKLVGPQSITCLESRTWYPEMPKCEWVSCEHILKGRKTMQCLPNPEDVKMALEIYKLSLDIELLELQRDRAKESTVQSPV
uniref:Complement component 4 binding protein alpha n=1 Tax=Canis lupus dingo TaxID=286419 RepID=A0A8C0KKG8_CANLU